ncbi:MAG: hypothetical protein HN380_15275 [Victivallales bacterium]|jgi:hypothetical protein|nr:hypothetical protein [Victivallales bacterium]
MRIPPPLRLFLIGVFAFASASLAQVGSPISKPLSLQQAKPVWPRGRETEKNLSIGFRCAFEAPTADGSTRLHLTASSLCRAFRDSVAIPGTYSSSSLPKSSK